MTLPTPIFLSTWISINMQKKKLYWRYIWFRNPAILLAKSILTHISASETFPNMRLVHAYNNQYKTFIIDQLRKKYWLNFHIHSKSPVLDLFSPFCRQNFPKKLKSQFQENRSTDRPFGDGWESDKRISQLRGIAVDNKDNFQYNSTNRNSLT